jgi:hypothetical protein
MKKGDKMRKLRISFGMENEDLLSAGHYGDSAFSLYMTFMKMVFSNSLRKERTLQVNLYTGTLKNSRTL